MNMKRRLIFILVSLALVLNLVAGARIYLSSAQAVEQKDSPDANLEVFASVLEKVRTSYVDGTNLTYNALIHSALKGMVGSLDPHSEFMDADDYQQLQDDTEGQFGGLGLVVAMKNNFITVVAPMDDSPGYRAGTLSGDRIVKIDGKSVDNVSLTDAVKKLRGQARHRGQRDCPTPVVGRGQGLQADARRSSAWTWSRTSTAKKTSRSVRTRSAMFGSRSSAIRLGRTGGGA